MRLLPNQVLQIVSLCRRISDLEGIYLFGSSAGADFRKDSDLDLGIKSTDGVDPILLWNLKDELSQVLKIEVDLVDMKSADTVLLMEIVTKGKRVFSADVNRSEAFESLIYSQYLQLNEDRAEILRAIEESGSVYG